MRRLSSSWLFGGSAYPSCLKLHLAAGGFFSLIAFITVYPLVFNNGHRAAGYDWFFPHWAFWWVRHALSSPELQVYESSFVMFPHTSNYAYNALALFWFPLWSLLEPITGTLTAITLIITLACMLNGYVFFVFLRSEAIAPGPALIGGMTLQIFPIVRYFYYNSHINLMNWFLISILLILWKWVVYAAETRRLSRTLIPVAIMGTGLWVTVLSDLQFAIFAGFIMGPYGIWTISTRPAHRTRLIGLACLAILLTTVLLTVVGPIGHLHSEQGTFVPGSVDERPTIDFPDDFLKMADTWWDWSTPSLGAFVPLSTLGTILFAIMWKKSIDRKIWLWMAILLPPLIFSIGPSFTLGEYSIQMPYRLLYSATSGNFRMPWRLAPSFVLGAMVCIGYLWTSYTPVTRGKRAFLFGGIMFLLAIDLNLFVGGPTQPVLPRYTAYDKMRSDPYDYVVLEVPTGAGSGEVLLGDADAIAFQYYGITHEKRMVNGFVSRAPIENFWYLHFDDPMMAWLGQRRLLEPEIVEAQLRDRIFGWPIGYLVVHQDYIEANGVQPVEVIGYLNSLNNLLCAPDVEGNAVFYRTVWHPTGCAPRLPTHIAADATYTIDIGSTGDERYIGWGWHWQEVVAGLTLRWTGDQPQTEIYTDLPPGDYQMTISMQAYLQPRQVQIFLNGQLLPESVIVQPDGLVSYAFHLPAALVGRGEHLTISLEYDGWLIPSDVGQSSDQRKLAVAIDWIQFRLNSP